MQKSLSFIFWAVKSLRFSSRDMKWFHLFYRKLTPLSVFGIILELKENWDPRAREIVAWIQTREVEILNCLIWPEQWASEGRNWEEKLEHLMRRGSIMKLLTMGNRQVSLERTRRWSVSLVLWRLLSITVTFWGHRIPSVGTIPRFRLLTFCILALPLATYVSLNTFVAFSMAQIEKRYNT